MGCPTASHGLPICSVRVGCANVNIATIQTCEASWEDVNIVMRDVIGERRDKSLKANV